MKILHRLESYEIMGACFEVYKEKGCGFLEAVYQECISCISWFEIPSLRQSVAAQLIAFSEPGRGSAGGQGAISAEPRKLAVR